MIFPFGETVTVLARVAGAPDRYGNVTFTWPSPGVDFVGAFDPGTSDESLSSFRNPTNTRPTVYAPPDTAVTGVDRLIVRGATYEVDGEPGDWRSPFTGWEPGLEIKLKRLEG